MLQDRVINVWKKLFLFYILILTFLHGTNNAEFQITYRTKKIGQLESLKLEI